MRIRVLLSVLLLAVLGCGGSGSVTPPVVPGYTLTVTPPAFLQPGQSGPATATLVRSGGDQAAVTLALAATTPQGITSTASTIAAGASTGTLTLSVAADVPLGTYSLTVDADDGVLAQHTASFSLAVVAPPDFSLAVASPPAAAVGSYAPAAVTVTRNASGQGTITLGVAANAQGITGTGSLAAGASTGQVVLGVPAGVSPGTYPLTVTATYDSVPSLVRTAPVSLLVALAAPVTFSIPVLYISQATQTEAFDVPLVANRPGRLRAFVVASGTTVARPYLNVVISQGATTLFSQAIAAPEAVPTAVAEGGTTSAWDVAIPAAAIQPGSTLLATLDAGGVTWPASGTPDPLDVRTLPDFHTTFWAVQTGDGRVGGGGTLASSYASYQTFLQKVWPVNQATTATYGGVFPTTQVLSASDTTGTAWSAILRELRAKQVGDNVTGRQYFGVVNPNYPAGIAGLGYVGAATAIGWDKADSNAYGESGVNSGVYAHETGHNFGLNHAPCGGPTDSQGWPATTPYADALIGVWGVDVATDTLKDPTLDHDIMSYCAPIWVSDYNYGKALANRQSGSAALVAAPAAAADSTAPRSLLVWGSWENGAATLEPAFHLPVDAQLPAAGSHLLEGLDAAGQRLFAVPFEPSEVADLPGEGQVAHFAFAVPLAAADAAKLAELRWTRGGDLLARRGRAAAAASRAPQLQARFDGQADLAWDAAAEPMVLVRDPATGSVLGFGRDGAFSFPAGAGDLELHLSNGVTSRSVTRRLP